MAEDWTDSEVALITADYLEMLKAELLDQPINKTSHRQALAPHLNARSPGSIEFKHQNISAILVNMGLPYIDGYKPRGNYQALLETTVRRVLDERHDFFDQFVDVARVNPAEVPIITNMP